MHAFAKAGRYGAVGFAVVGALMGSTAASSAAEPVVAAVPGPDTVEVGWPFDTCDPHDYLLKRGVFERNWLFVFDHWDGANFYKVRDTAGDVVGNGWASCHP
ncbi:hypothetical protein ACFQ05_38105 [Amycolatopsis umgeniensis]|uniref:Secreted protein n=1 Tax=Amycolatopsis umgeniensis TaxID=336628 RepID=A0A841AXZ3_9PSEU|nr:hypothetical protein [Amycolatopsis umgeniensis]MBB5851242.1 hypothetical protein [Amycolatopsis umgeniensis]